MFFKVIRFCFAVVATTTTAVSAGELLYNPINPGFGGNPNNIDYLLNLAEIQNEFVETSEGGGGGGGVPDISFPPITIDLGNVGGGVPQTGTPAATTTQP
ncbi:MULTISPECIES: curli assembly protein CsgF [unclassified Sulfitobacter]|uniref:curli assembly protein CsgF n=1 Tax=unclassified Sulfitobacter TaxID=196795 RepID=UPI0023E19577|nr:MULTISPECIES: curli assembly protein CsgF [unclassified Sulfitobacter]MDF3384595.1 hypothetical protein [Sulfitobacter sp. Ks11]MDF3388084.1 hypothetical protein [Sulfitobacter sp. M85]MDF3391504.1 hypothetical protein [Sulfitobacter sp. Ks16]MDF3402071.1 hypothetical protein [Sulfitobacter sp. KE39]MDF3405563.1 hypothetical protein [Sulfitobacter sp. Ks35]